MTMLKIFELWNYKDLFMNIYYMLFIHYDKLL